MNQLEIQFCTLKQEDAKQIQDVIIQANLNTFPFLVHKCQTLQYFESSTRELMQCSFKCQQIIQNTWNQQIEYNFGLRINGRLIAVILSIQMAQRHNFIKLLFQKNKYEAMFNGLNLDTVGTGVYLTRLSVLPQMKGKGYGKKLLYQSAKYLFNRGYKESIIISIMEVSRKMFMELGGQLIMHQQAVRPTLTYQINVIKNNFKLLIETYQSSAQK